MALLTRVRLNAQATISHTFRVDEALADASGNVTYTVKRLDGTTVTSGTASHPGGVGLYQFVLAAQALVDFFTVDWTGSIGGGNVTVTDYVEIVGGFLFSLDEMRNAKPALSTVQYSTQDLIDARLEAEVTAERICGHAFVPRFGRAELDGNNDFALVLPVLDLRTIRAVAVGTNQSNRVLYDSTSLSAVEPGEAGIISRRGAVWLWGRKNIVVEFEYGMNYPPEYIRRAAIVHARSLLSQTNTSMAKRASQVDAHNGVTYVLSQPTLETVGIPMVDAAYGRFSDSAGFA